MEHLPPGATLRVPRYGCSHQIWQTLEAQRTNYDRFKNSNTRKYTFRQDGVTLDGDSRKDFLSAITTYEKLEARRKDEEARACALITSSFSEEAKM